MKLRPKRGIKRAARKMVRIFAKRDYSGEEIGGHMKRRKARESRSDGNPGF